MRKTRPHRREKQQAKKLAQQFAKNEEIRSPEVMVIDENGVNHGKLSLSAALQLAKEHELDLVEVFPKAVPPVAKILDYGKFVYRQEKNARKQKANQKRVDIKGIRLSLRISDHDLDIRRKQADGFLEEGDKVRVEMILRGRERQFTQNAIDIVNGFIQNLTQSNKIESPLTKMGGKITITIAPKQN